MEPDPQTDTQNSLPSPPPLPARLLALPPLIYAGTGIWLVVFCVLLIMRYGFGATPPIWLWTALAGVVLGVIGLFIMWWQRTASRRGNRGAQRDL
jgi:hypothetical protein